MKERERILKAKDYSRKQRDIIKAQTEKKSTVSDTSSQMPNKQVRIVNHQQEIIQET